MGRHPFISILDRPQVAEGRCGYAGSNKAFSVERDSVWKEQLLEPLALLERRLNPQVGGAWQNAFCERQDALYVQFIELPGVTVNPHERELLAQFFPVKATATPQMKNVPLHERGPLLSAAIQAGTDAVQGQRILLVDDLWETGSTLRRVAEVLGQMGATEIRALAMTRTK